MKTVPVYLNQNILDIAIQEYGSAAAVTLLMADNPDDMSWETPYARPGARLAIREGLYENDKATPKNVEIYKSDAHKPASGDFDGCGIGYWIITDDFVVGGTCQSPDDPTPTTGIGFDTIPIDNAIV